MKLDRIAYAISHLLFDFISCHSVNVCCNCTLEILISTMCAECAVLGVEVQ